MSIEKTPGIPTPANPTPAGLVGLAVAAFCFVPYLLGLVGKTPGVLNAMPLMACWLAGGFIIQIIVALADLKSGNSSGGNTFLYFSAFFMLTSALEFVTKSLASGLDTRIDGYAWIAITLVVWLWAPAFLKTPALLFLIVVGIGVACPMIALVDLKILSPAIAKICATIAAGGLGFCGIIAIYLSAAMVVNTAFGRKVLPNPAPFYKGA